VACVLIFKHLLSDRICRKSLHYTYYTIEKGGRVRCYYYYYYYYYYSYYIKSPDHPPPRNRQQFSRIFIPLFILFTYIITFNNIIYIHTRWWRGFIIVIIATSSVFNFPTTTFIMLTSPTRYVFCVCSVCARIIQ